MTLPVDRKFFRVHNAHNRSESYEYLRDEGAVSLFPIIIDSAGNSIWHTDVAVERKDGVRAFELVTAGNCRFVQNGREYLVEPGMMSVQHRGASTTYTVGPAGFVHKRWVGIRGDSAEPLFDKYGLTDKDVFTLRHPLRFVALMKQAHRLLRSPDPRFHTELSVLAYRILVTVGGDITGPRYPAPVDAAIRFMHLNILRPLSVHEISAAAGLSASRFYSLFRTHVGDTPSHYFTTLRLGQAQHLLAHTRKSVKEILDFLGYKEPSYFSGQFRKVYGVSPREYRKSLSAH